MILFKVLTKKFVKDGASQLQNFCVNFHKFHALFCIKIITFRLGCHHKLCARWILAKMFTGVHKMQRIALSLIFLEQYHKDGNEFLNDIIRVTGDETWVSFVNVETKEQ
jgi:hypothetical protein